MQTLLFSAMVLLAADSFTPHWHRHTIDNSSRGADGVRLADVNGNGLADVVTGWEEGGLVRAYINPGAETARQPWPAVTVGKVKSPEDAVFADLDGDGALDVVSSCEGGTQSIFFHWSPKDKTQFLDADAWQTQAVPAAQNRQLWMFALPMDVDGENGIDLIVGSKGGGASIGWLRSPADPRRIDDWTYHPLRAAAWIMSLRSIDMDGDGDLDILASDRKGAARGVFWLKNPGRKAAAAGADWPEHPIGGDDRECMFLTTGDLDGDGVLEVVCAVKDRGLSVFRRTSIDAAAWTHHEIAMPDHCGTGKGIAVCDVNLDGRQDIVFSCENASGGKSGVRWLSYQESPWQSAWTDHEISGPVGVKFDRLETIDLDGDGDLDVMTCEERDNLGVVWYENPTR